MNMSIGLLDGRKWANLKYIAVDVVEVIIKTVKEDVKHDPLGVGCCRGGCQWRIPSDSDGGNRFPAKVLVGRC